jgi:hypothetical protein
MAEKTKVLLELELNCTPAEFEEWKDDFFQNADPELISIDKAYLPDDPKDDSFVLMRFAGVK